LKHPSKEPLDCKAIVTSMVGETHEHVRHVLKDNLGEVERKPNFKNLASAQKSKFSKPLFMGSMAFMHAIKKWMHFLFMHFLQHMLIHNNMRFLLNIKATRMCLKRKMLTPYHGIDHMIA
jgi:hypothetical protein